MRDYGYDVSNYRDVDPIFGTLADFDALIAEAHRLGLRVMIDLVISHTSDQQPWFVESRSSRFNAKADWYVGPMRSRMARRPQLALHLRRLRLAVGSDPPAILHAQLPDLAAGPHLHNPEVQEELLAVERFWLERGVDGFPPRHHHFYFHDQLLARQSGARA